MEPSRTHVGRGVRAVLAAALVASCAFALNPSLDISQYAHISWRLDEGSFKGAVHSIAQTPDGFLWLGTEFGLVRFDGVKVVEWPIAQLLPATQIRSLLAGRDGTLWLGTARGLASMKAGRGTPDVRRYREFDGETIFGLVEDGAGNVWAGGSSAIKATLCAIGKGCVPFDERYANFGSMVGNAYRDRKENIWVGTLPVFGGGVPGRPSFIPCRGKVGSTL